MPLPGSGNEIIFYVSRDRPVAEFVNSKLHEIANENMNSFDPASDNLDTYLASSPATLYSRAPYP